MHIFWQSPVRKYSNLEHECLGGSSLIPWTLIPGFLPGMGLDVKTMDTFVVKISHCIKVPDASFSKAYTSAVSCQKAVIFGTWLPWRVLL